MSEINLPPFYVGQKVVSVVNKPHVNIIIGTTHSVLGIYKLSSCNCNVWLVDVGHRRESKAEVCSCHKCNVSGPVIGTGLNSLAPSEWFAPVQENFQSISLEKVMETETPLISVN